MPSQMVPPATARTTQPSLRLAYLVTRYPAVNHAFMLREIQQLRRMGFDISVASILPPDRSPERLTPEEREETSTTFYVTAQSAASVVAAQARAIASRPVGYLKGLACAVRLARGHVRATLNYLLYFAEAVVVGDWMRRNGFGHVHTHYASHVAVILSHIFPISISAALHGPDEFKDPVEFALCEKVEASRFICAISDFGRSQIMMSCDYSQWQKLHVTRLGVDTSAFCPVSFREHPHPFEVLCAGRLAPVKGQHVLIDALEILVRHGRAVRLRIAGGGPDRASLQAHALAAGLADSVEFTGFLNQRELREIYEQTDAFVLPSFAEGVPVVLMEAMSLGIPCIATWVNGIPELIRNEVDGLAVAPGDPNALAAAIARCMDDCELRRKLSLAGRARARELADLATNVRHLADIFVQYLGAEPAQSTITVEPVPRAEHQGGRMEQEESAVELRC